MAAESSLSAGKTYFSSLGMVVLDVHKTKPVCHEEIDKSSETRIRIANGMRAMGAALSKSNETTTNCQAIGNRVQCTTAPGPAPIPLETRTVCEGGGVPEWIDYMETFELIDDAEAATRADPLIPLHKRPINARAILAPPKVIRSSSSERRENPFAD